MAAKKLKYVVVRTFSAGCFAGELVSRKGQEVVMRNARRLWHWNGAASLSQLAIDGVSDPRGCKFPDAVSEIVLPQAIEIISATQKARKSIEEVSPWRA